jgi:protease-4
MRLLFTFLTTILKLLWRFISFSRGVIANLLLILLLLILVVGWFGQETVTLPDHAALLLRPTGNITEAAPPTDSWHKLLQQEIKETPDSPLQDILDVIAASASDPRITLLVLDLGRLNRVSLSQSMTIGKALQKFKKSGKKVIAMGDNFSQSHYLLACQADEIILNPIGGVELEGFSRYRLYGRQTLEKLKVNFNLFRAGEYKSALEPFFRDDMSTAARTANQKWLDDLWLSASQNLLTHRRQLDENKLNDYINNYDRYLVANNGSAADAALNAGLVDRLLTRPQAREYLAGLTGTTAENSHDFAQINWLDYSQQIEKSYQHPPTSAKIAIIVARGEIVPGRQPDSKIGAESLSRLLRQTRNDPDVKAVVLRLDSGGGSMTASEIIRQEVLQLKESGKPVVVSMGRLAASGAYWISADADEIWAEPTTLTGSIGVFGAWPTFEESLAEIGIHNDGVSTHPAIGSRSLTRPLQPRQARALQLNVNRGYRRFLEIVAGGRRLSLMEVEKLAGGRVFSGHRAKDLGLIDHLGSLSDAVRSAAARVGLKRDDAVYLQNETDNANLIRDILDTRLHIDSSLLTRFLPQPYTSLTAEFKNREKAFFNLSDPQNLYVYSLLDSFTE